MPDTHRTVEEIDTLITSAELLRSWGFNTCYVTNDLHTLQVRSARESLHDTNVDRLYLYQGIPPERGGHRLAPFRYPASRLHHELGINGSALTMSEQGCGGFLMMIEAAVRSVEANDAKRVLCVAGDALGSDRREIIYNLMSDAACSLIVEENATYEVLHVHQTTQSYYWDTPKRENELLAAYFPIARNAITAALEAADLSMNEIDWIVPHNVSLRSWDMLVRILDVPEGRLWAHNISEFGHTVACDHVINLKTMEQDDRIKPGMLLLLFTFGFGATWTTMIVRYRGS